MNIECRDLKIEINDKELEEKKANIKSRKIAIFGSVKIKFIVKDLAMFDEPLYTLKNNQDKRSQLYNGYSSKVK